MNPRSSVYLACGLFARGNVSISDMNRNISRLKSSLEFIHFNPDAFKIGKLTSLSPCHLMLACLIWSVSSSLTHSQASTILVTVLYFFASFSSFSLFLSNCSGLCSVPPVGQKSSLLCVANNCVISETFEAITQRCLTLYSRKAHFHHYTEYMEEHVIQECLQLIDQVTQDYKALAYQNEERKNEQEVSAGMEKVDSTKHLGYQRSHGTSNSNASPHAISAAPNSSIHSTRQVNSLTNALEEKMRIFKRWTPL